MWWKLLGLIGVLMLAACGGDGTPTSPSGGVGSEAALRSTVGEYHQALIAWDAGNSYPFMSAAMRERCSYSDWVAFLTTGRLLLGEDLYAGAKTVFDSVRIEDDRGFIEGRLMRDDIELLSFPDLEDEYLGWWEWTDGHWRLNTEDPTPCDLGD